MRQRRCADGGNGGVMRNAPTARCDHGGYTDVHHACSVAYGGRRREHMVTDGRCGVQRSQCGMDVRAGPSHRIASAAGTGMTGIATSARIPRVAGRCRPSTGFKPFLQPDRRTRTTTGADYGGINQSNGPPHG